MGRDSRVSLHVPKEDLSLIVESLEPFVVNVLATLAVGDRHRKILLGLKFGGEGTVRVLGP